MPDSKPFTCEREANDAPASRQARAAVDAMFRAGTFRPGDHEAPNTAIVLDALNAAGVEISDWEAGTFRWLGGWETYHSAIIARVIEAAYESGRASALEDAGTEWGLLGLDGAVTERTEEEGRARADVEMFRSVGTSHRLVSRQVGPWREADA